MNKITDYVNFVEQNGQRLSKINLGSDEIALRFEDALKAVEILKNSDTPILGGDILLENNNQLAYAYHVLGDKYLYLNWYCKKVQNETVTSFTSRSHKIAVDSIMNANEIAKQYGKSCFIVLVI